MQESINCAQCGASNPLNNKFCGECGARLQAIAAPTAAALPGWLVEDAGPTQPAAPAPEATPGPAPSRQYDLPDWLREEPAATGSDLQAGPAPADPGLPDWLAQAEDQQPPRAEPRADLPDWLQDANKTPPEQPAPAPDTVEPALPAWLAELSVADEQIESPASAAGDDLPAWMKEPQEPAAAETAPVETPPELPAWLLQTEDPAPQNVVAAEPKVTTGALPAWLLAETEETPTNDAGAAPTETSQLDGAAPAEASTMPAWLRDDQPRAPEAATDLLPSWLQEAEADEAAGTAEPASANDAPARQAEVASGLPSWLVDIDTPQDEPDQGGEPQFRASSAETAAPRDEGPPLDSLPDWLRIDDAPSAEAAPAGAGQEAWAGASKGGEELPDWLRQAADEPQPSAEQPASELPDWLAHPAEETQGQPAGETARATGFDSSAGDEAAPAWLRDSPSGDAGADLTIDWLNEPAPVSQAPEGADDLPPWLQAIDSQAAEPAAISGRHEATGDQTVADTHVARIYADNGNESAAVDVGAADDAADDLPPWLAGLNSPAAQETSSLPSWLSEPESAPTNAPEEPREGSSGEFLPSLELPTWLHDTPPAPAAASDVDATPGWLQGLDSDVAVVPEPARAEALPQRAPIDRSPERLAAMQLLERMVVEPRTEPEPPPVDTRRGRTATAFQLLAFLLLLLAILGVLFGPPLAALRLGSARIEVASTVAQIDAVPARAPVLLAYEWDARRSMELEPLESAVLAALTEQQAPIMLITTDPQGALLSRRRADVLRARNDNFYNQPGLGFVDLGYKPGGVLALGRLASNFGSAFEQDWAGANLQSQTNVIQTMCASPTGAVADCRLDQLGMLVVLVDESEDARVWIEQVASAAPEVPVTFVAPAEAAPLIRPYLTRPNITMVAGLQDAVALQARGGSVDPRLARRADATVAGGAVFGLLLLLGMIPALWSGRRARRMGRANIWER